MLDICLYVEKRSLDLDDLTFHRWAVICRAFAVDHCYIIDNTGFHESFMHKIDAIQCPVTIVGDYDEIESPLPVVFVEKDVPTNRVALQYDLFTHPEDAMYCFGGDHCGMQQAWHEGETNESGDWINIPVEMIWAREAVTSLWADQAASIVLAHRRVQHANS